MQRIYLCRGMGHEGDELCSYEDMGFRCAVRKLSLRWHVQGADLNTDDIDEDDPKHMKTTLWNPRGWSSKSILDTRLGV
jgi:hypothetical protein